MNLEDTRPARALEGIRVLDLTGSIAGPWGTQILGALGADVVKVEHPRRGDDTRHWGPPFWNGESAAFLANNSNKRSLAIDLGSEAGREAVLRLAAEADVFVQSLRPGRAERLGFGFEALRERNPEIVYCSIGAFGAAGPLRDRPGYDPLMQAAGGIVSVTGEEGRPPVRCGASIVDQGTGMWAALGILAALRARDRDGGAQLVETSLYETALNWLPRQLLDYLGSGEVPRRLGSALDILAPYQAFEAADGWIIVAAGNDRLFAVLCEEIGRPELAADSRFATNADRVANRAELEPLIAAPLRAEPAAEWLRRLEAVGVPVAPVQDIAAVATSEQTAALGILQPLPHPEVPDLRVVAPPLSFNGSRLGHVAPAPTLARHSRELLGEAGFDEGEIDELVREEVVSVGAQR